MPQSQLIFDPATGIVSPDTSAIREAVVEDWVQAFASPDAPILDTEPTTPAGQLIDAEVAEIEAKNAAILYVANQFNPRVNDGFWQDAIGYIYFLSRKLDEPSVVTCQITGLNGTPIPYGALAQSVTGYILICNRAVTIGPSGTIETTFRCSEPGPIEFAAHSVTQIVTVIPGWDTIDNEAPGVIGRDRETRSEFERRRYDSVAANAHGSVAAIYGTIANIAGVLDVKVLENVGPDPITEYGVEVPGHGITVCVYGGEDVAIAEAIYRKKDAGADTGGNTEVSYTDESLGLYPGGVTYTYLIMRPTPVEFWVQVTLGNSNAVTVDIINDIKRAVYNNFNGLSSSSRVGLAQTVYASRFYCSVSSVSGVISILGIKIYLGSTPPDASDYVDVITINGDQMPTMDLDSTTVIISGE